MQAGEQAGSSVAGTDDLSGDSNQDFVAGSPGKDQAASADAGAVWLVLESPTLAVVQNRPPVADAGATVSPAECDGNLQGAVWLDGSLSSDPDSTPGTNDDIVSFQWFEGQTLLTSGETVSFPFDLGTHDVTLQVTDRFGLGDADPISILVQDSMAPVGGITAPADDSCHGPAALPVVVTEGFADVCDPAIATTFDPPPGPAYDTHGDYLVTVTATDGSGNTASDGVAFAIDTVLPTVTILSPPDGVDIETDLPLDVVFDATDEDGAAGGVVLEQIFLDDCLVYDGRSYGNGDGLLQDETISLTEEELCRVVEQCGFTSLLEPVLRVDATDCGGNLASDSVQFGGDIAINPGVCVPIETMIENSPATIADWDEHTGVLHYDVVRGELAKLRDEGDRIDLGPVTCVEGNSIDTTTAGHEDPIVPRPGQVLFYVIRSDDGVVETSYGRSSGHKKRFVERGGDCH